MLLTTSLGFAYWLRQHNIELLDNYRAEYLAALGKFLNLTQLEIELRRDNKDINSQRIYDTYRKRAEIEYEIDMARVKIGFINKSGYDDKINPIDKKFKQVFVDLIYEHENKKYTLWKAFTKSFIGPNEIEIQVDGVRECVKNV